jgi:hypothetical protein
MDTPAWRASSSRQQDLLQGVHRQPAAAGPGSAGEAFDIAQPALDALILLAPGGAQQGAAGGDLRPVEQRTPGRGDLHVHPQPAPAVRTGRAVIVHRARTQQHQIARSGGAGQAAVGAREAPAAGEGEQQLMVGGAALAAGGVAVGQAADHGLAGRDG